MTSVAFGHSESSRWAFIATPVRGCSVIEYIVTARAYDRAVGRGRSPRPPRPARRATTLGDARARWTISRGTARRSDSRATRVRRGEVKAAFKRAARAAHPDAAGCAVKFREVVAARDALLGRGRSRDAAYARGGAAAAAAARGGSGGRQTRAFAAVLATPFFVAAMVSTTLPKSNESGANAEIGRVHGWINAPVNAWLKEDRREPGDGNRERFWKTGRVNAK